MDPSRTHEEMGKEKSKETGKEIGQLPPKRSKRNKTDGAQKEGGRAEGKKKRLGRRLTELSTCFKVSRMMICES